jgi:UDP:flavonoid glycosyltransferase YjiC (YdhE family)
MRVLIVPAGISSHLFPMVPLAWALCAAGHEVRVAGQPGVLGAAVSSGLTAVEVGASYDLFAGITSAGTAIRRETGEGPDGKGGFAAMSAEARRRYAAARAVPHVKAAAAMADDLVDVARAWMPDVVLTDPITLAAPLAAAALGVPVVHHLWGPQPPSLAKFPGYGAAVESWPEELLELYDRYGVRPEAHMGVCTVAPGPPALQSGEVPFRQAARYMVYNGSGVVPEPLRRPSPRPRVCVSWQTTTTVSRDGSADHPLKELITSLTRLAAEVVVALRKRDRDALGPVPPGVLVVEDLPLQVVLRDSAVAVNHGGAGTVLTAACHGVPQVITPFDPGQNFNGECLASTGAAMVADLTDAAAAAAAVESMLTDGTWTKAAQALRDENLAQPSAAALVEVLEGLA